MMWNTEEAYKLTESIYRNLSESFNPAIRQIIACGKAYHKALSAVSSPAKAFIEALAKAGHNGQKVGKGGTEELGASILRIAEIQKEMHTKFEECTRAVFSELIIPLENRLDNDFKNATAEHRKYLHGHKGFVSPYIKSHEALRKFQKKSKSKRTFDEQKESQYVRAVTRCKEKLDEFRIQGLKLALLEERKYYCYLLDRLSSLCMFQATYCKRGFDMLMPSLSEWKQMSCQPHILPRAADGFLRPIDDRCEMSMSSPDPYRHHNGYGYASQVSTYSSPARRLTTEQAEMMHYSSKGDYAVPAAVLIGQSKTLPRKAPTGPPGLHGPLQGPPQGQCVRAIYSHMGSSDNQLTFADGDMITLIGEKADGWQYGYNARNGKYGWFPLSFTEDSEASDLDVSQPQGLHHRAKSIGDLIDARSDNSVYSFDTDVAGSNRRPRSLYEGSGMRLVHPGQWTSTPRLDDSFAFNSSTDSAPVGNSPGSYPLPPPPAPQQIYQTLPDAIYDRQQLMRNRRPDSLPSPSMLTPGKHFMHDSFPAHPNYPPPSPPLPPPPPPLIAQDHSEYSSQSVTPVSTPTSLSQTPTHSMSSSAYPTSLSRSPSVRSLYYLPVEVECNPPQLQRKLSTRSYHPSMEYASATPTHQSRPRSHSQSSRKDNKRSKSVGRIPNGKRHSPIPPPLPKNPPPSIPPPIPRSFESQISMSMHNISSVCTTLSQNSAHSLGLERDLRNRGDSPNIPPPQPPHHPDDVSDLPPPPPTDYGQDDSHQRNPMFASVKLRKAETNDRSAPRIN
ncbi:brain-specific angiogenesis inhibitor 1-associated protein 2-like protein 2 isoform X2 [Gigantopelta aegis]|uniref:brain-specific angiogenesis inhibitor 1-associated protein 2-like protein 2 isoform X2 n=1 Tax=Gigantopelta aegis TaxID=1735272 RepID=UPI001B889B67|nr:brain-specific angiogenesis inhibitor 1-associated protein 2-like protein 2 isoform X2 [Gigantopelta aegis]